MGYVDQIPPRIEDIKFPDSASAIKTLLDDDWQIVKERIGGLIALIGEEDRTTRSDKLYWLEKVYQKQQDTINNGTAVLAAHTSMTVTNINRWRVKQVFSWGTVGAAQHETCLVTSVDVQNSKIYFSRDHNGLSAQPTTIADGTTVFILGELNKSMSRSNEIGHHTRPAKEYNDWMTFRKDLSFDHDMESVAQYGFDSAAEYEDYQEELFMFDWAGELNDMLQMGERATQNLDSDIYGEIRGWFTWLMQSGTNKTDKNSAAITATVINDILNDTYRKDISSRELALVMGDYQARQLAKFNTALANRLESTAPGDRTASGAQYKTVYVGDLEAYGANQIIVDFNPTFPQDIIAGLNFTKMKLVYAPGGRLYKQDTTPVDLMDAHRTGYRMKLSAKMGDHTNSHFLIYDLATS